MTLKERLLTKIRLDKKTACWNWTGTIGLQGYGQLSINDRSQKAHRTSYEVHRGPIPKGLFVCHHCDNRACINPRHLFVGTNQENTADKVAKGRQARGPRIGRLQRGMNNANRKLSEADVAAIRNAAGVYQKVLAKRYGVTQSHISLIRRGGCWS